MTIRMVELFSGVGAQAMAMENLGLDHKVVAICEIDKSAVKSYYAIHGETPNLGDITKVEKLPDCDLLTYTFPCQDLSMAGNKKGCARGSGTRSGLLWEVERLLLEMKEGSRLPMTLLMENVPALGFKANIRDFNEWISSLSGMGYTSSYKVLDAADFGVPQRRKRLFMISRLDGVRFDFPKPRPLDKCLADVLEENVPESYFLKPELVAKYEAHKVRQIENGRGFGWDPYEPRERETGNCLTQNPTRNTQNFIKSRGVE